MFFNPLRVVLWLLLLPVSSWAAATDSLSLSTFNSGDTTAVLADSIANSADRWAIAAAANMSYLFHHSEYTRRVLHSYGSSHFDLRVKWQPGPRHQTVYDRALGHPMLQAGLLYTDFSHVHVYKSNAAFESRIGHIWALYGGMQLEFLHRGRWTLGADLIHGVAYCPNPFDENTNPDNELIGSRLTIFVSGGLFARYRVSPQWSLSLGADFKHFSNGTLDRPNLGANLLGATVAVQYDLQPQPMREDAARHSANALPHANNFYVETLAGMGLKALIDRFAVFPNKHNPIYAFPVVMVAPMYRWHLLHATGLAIDYTYADYIYRVQEYDQMRHTEVDNYSPHIAGISLRHELFYRRFSVNVGVGYYLLNHTGYTYETNESRVFQNVGLRYSPTFARGHLFVGYNVKAHHFSKVNCVQLVLGCRIGRLHHQ